MLKIRNIGITNFHYCVEIASVPWNSLKRDPTVYLYIYISSVRVYVTELLLNGWTDLNEIFCVPSEGFENGLDSQ